VELLRTVLQIDQAMTKRVFDDAIGYDVNPFGLLCRRLHFPTFDMMVVCLIDTDSSIEIIQDSVDQCIGSYENTESESRRIYPGSRGEKL
jgi:hypothetical protein